MAEYGALAHPLREGMAPAMAANNVAYRRDTLRKMSDALDSLLEIDYFLQNALGSGFRTASAPRALLAHQTNRHLADLLRGHFIYAQLFALRRLQFENWGLPKRLAGAAAMPMLVPLLRIRRLFQAISGRSNVSRAMAGLPVILLLYCAGALGEAWGLLHRQADPEAAHLAGTGIGENFRMTERQGPFVSVIILAYYSAATLPSCLDALRGQTYRAFEVILINSSQETGTQALVCAHYPEVLFEQQTQRLLPHAARNCGAALAREVRCRNSLPLHRADGCSKERISLENGCGALHPVKTAPEDRAGRDLLQYHPCGLKKIIRKRISGYMRRFAGKFPPAGAMRTAAIGNPRRISVCIDFFACAASRPSVRGCSAGSDKRIAGSRLG
jgi:hypothetical protein